MSVQNSERDPRLRIGELSRRTGVAPDTLRAWERRYGLLEPARTEGGFRLYDDGDEARVRAMKSLLGAGISAAEAARAALASPPAPPASDAVVDADGAAPFTDRLVEALARYDEAGANAILDEAVAALSVEHLAVAVALPTLERIGEDWARGELTVAQEHFASNVLRGRLLGLARGWGTGAGPVALLACPPGEQHDLGLVAFGLALRGHGWRITFLGPDTPIGTVDDAAVRLDAALVVLAALETDRFLRVADAIERLAASRAVALGGAGADPRLAERLGVRILDGGPIEGAAAAASV